MGLDLRINKIGDEGAEALAEMLKVNEKVQVLDLRINKIGDEGAEALADDLAVNKTLESLYLTSNGIGDKDAEALADALATNKTLRYLYLQENEIGDKRAEAKLAPGIGKLKKASGLSCGRACDAPFLMGRPVQSVVCSSLSTMNGVGYNEGCLKLIVNGALS